MELHGRGRDVCRVELRRSGSVHDDTKQSVYDGFCPWP